MHTAPVLLLIVLFPLLGTVVTAINRNVWREGTISRVASATVAMSFIGTVFALFQLYNGPGDALGFEMLQWGPWGNVTLTLGLLGDPISLWWALVVTGVGFVIHVFSSGYMKDDPGFGRYFAQLNYFVFAMNLLVLSDNYLGLLIGWGNVGLASYTLIGFWNVKQEAAAAATKAFFVNTIGEIGMILALVLIFVQFGSFRFQSVFAQAPTADSGLLTVIGLLLLAGALAKSAQLPLHTWLPDAMQGPTPVSALIHAATMVTAGVYLVIRSAPIFMQSPTAMLTVAYIGGASALFGAIVALKQTDIKKVLAFSTMSQVGYMMLAAGVGAYSAAMFHFMTHALFKALLFLSAGAIIHYLGGEQDLRKMGGLGKRLPGLYWITLIGVLALAGAPPLAGFFSKEEILHGIKAAGHTPLWVVGMAVAALTAFYMFRFFTLIFAGAPQGQASKGKRAATVEERTIGPEMYVPLGVLAVFSVIGGWISIPGLTNVPMRFLLPALQRYVELDAAAPAWSMDAVWVVALACISATLAIVRFGPGRSGRLELLAAPNEPPTGFVFNGFHFDALYRTIVVRPARAVSRWIGDHMDPQGVDGIVLALADLVKLSGRGLHIVSTGLVRHYALAVIIGAAGILAYMLLGV